MRRYEVTTPGPDEPEGDRLSFDSDAPVEDVSSIPRLKAKIKRPTSYERVVHQVRGDFEFKVTMGQAGGHPTLYEVTLFDDVTIAEGYNHARVVDELQQFISQAFAALDTLKEVK